MASGYFLKGFADQFGSGLMQESKLARERFNYQKQRDQVSDAAAIKKQQGNAVIQNLLQQKTAQEVAQGEFENEDRQGAENFYRTALRPNTPDAWQDRHMEGKGLEELGLMSGVSASNEQDIALGGTGGFNYPVDSSILTTVARGNQAKDQRNFESNKTNLTGDLGNAQVLNRIAKKNPELAKGILETFSTLQDEKGKQQSTFAPSTLKKMIGEMDQLKAEGLPEDHPFMKAYMNKISGNDIEMAEFTKDEIDTLGVYFNLTGKMPSLGRGKQSTKIRTQIIQAAALIALKGEGLPMEEDKTPTEAALSMVSGQSDTKSIQGALNFLEKQDVAMGSFVDNIGEQVDRVNELSKDLKTFDTRILNKPLRFVRGSILGSPLQAKYDMFLTEIESEIGKLASGSAASIAELSQGAQEKWAKIHDKNLSVGDMLSLLEETKTAAALRHKTVQAQLDKTRRKMATRDFSAPPEIKTQAEFDQLPSGTIYREDGKDYRKP